MVSIDPDMDMLRCFMEAAKTESVTKAGKNIGLTQSGVSLKIRQPGEHLSVHRFNRSRKDLSLTLEGQVSLECAKRILSVHDDAVSRLTKPKASGNLRTGLTDYFIPELLPRLLRNSRKQYPNIHLKIQTGMGTDLTPLFGKRRAGFGCGRKICLSGMSREKMTPETFLSAIWKPNSTI